MQVYSIYDKLSKKEGDFLFFENDDVAIRAMSNNMINEAKKNVLFNVDDFELHVIDGVDFIRSETEGENSIQVCIPSGVQSGEDLFFKSRFVYDFAKIDIKKIREDYESERLSALEKDIQAIKTSLARRYSDA